MSTPTTTTTRARTSRTPARRGGLAVVPGGERGRADPGPAGGPGLGERDDLVRAQRGPRRRARPRRAGRGDGRADGRVPGERLVVPGRGGPGRVRAGPVLG